MLVVYIYINLSRSWWASSSSPNQDELGGGALQHSMYPSSPSRPMAPGLARYGSAPSSLLNRHLQSLVPNADAGFLAQFFPGAGFSDRTEQNSSGALERSSSSSGTAAPASSSSPTALARHSSSPCTAGFLSHLALDNNCESPTTFSLFFSFSSSSSPGSDSADYLWRNRPTEAPPKNPATFFARAAKVAA